MSAALITPATAADIPNLLRTMAAAYAAYAGWLDPPSGVAEETAATLAAKLAIGGGFIAQREGEVLGCVLFQLHDEYVYLGRLAVVAQARGRGIGRALTAQVEAAAIALGRPRVTLGVRLALPQNIRFFEQQGYTITGYASHPGYAQPTFATLEKHLV